MKTKKLKGKRHDCQKHLVRECLEGYVNGVYVCLVCGKKY
jgi:hypothetical protein